MRISAPKYLPGAVVGFKMSDVIFKVTTVRYAVIVDVDSRRTWEYDLVDGGRRFREEELFEIATGGVLFNV